MTNRVMKLYSGMPTRDSEGDIVRLIYLLSDDIRKTQIPCSEEEASQLDTIISKIGFRHNKEYFFSWLGLNEGQIVDEEFSDIFCEHLPGDSEIRLLFPALVRCADNLDCEDVFSDLYKNFLSDSIFVDSDTVCMRTARGNHTRLGKVVSPVYTSGDVSRANPGPRRGRGSRGSQFRGVVSHDMSTYSPRKATGKFGTAVYSSNEMLIRWWNGEVDSSVFKDAKYSTPTKSEDADWVCKDYSKPDQLLFVANTPGGVLHLILDRHNVTATAFVAQSLFVDIDQSVLELSAAQATSVRLSKNRTTDKVGTDAIEVMDALYLAYTGSSETLPTRREIQRQTSKLLADKQFTSRNKTFGGGS